MSDQNFGLGEKPAEAQGGEAESPQDEFTQQPIPLEYLDVENAPAVFSDVALVAHSEDSFSLYFFQMQVPPFVGGKNEARVERAKAKCVVRVILTPARMFQLMQAMERNVVRYQEKLEAQTKRMEAALKRAEERGE